MLLLRSERACLAALSTTILAACALPACTGTVTVAPDEGEGVVLTEDVPNFSWVVPDKLAGMAQPGSSNPLDQDLATLQGHGIRLLVSLTTTPTSADVAAGYDIEILHLPVVDFTAPTLEQLSTFATQADASISASRSVGVHCAAGKGRTGTFLAAWFVFQGMPAEEAIAEVRRLRPGSIETEEQEQAVRDYAEYLASHKD
jgi:atypical dual specificity phosphatase